VAAVPVLTVAYMLGIIILTTHELLRSRLLGGDYRDKEQKVFDVVGKNNMLLKQFDDVSRYRRILYGSWLPLTVLAVGLLLESCSHHRHVSGRLLTVSSEVTSLLALFCIVFLIYLDSTIDQILRAAEETLGANLSLSIECDRRPLDGDSDCLAINAKLLKGDWGYLSLRDAQASVYWEGQKTPCVESFHFISSDQTCESSPLSSLTPGDTMEMSDTCKVPIGKVCKVEVLVYCLPRPRPKTNVSGTPHPGPLFWLLQAIRKVLPLLDKKGTADADRPPLQWRASHIAFPCSKQSSEKPPT
jgi:hypothetical protein